MEAVKIGGQAQSLGKKIGKGGEGDVYSLQIAPDRAVKIYREALRGQREAKVRAMVEGQLAAATDLVAFPAQIVTDLGGSFAGFVMRLVSGHRAIHELYGPKSRKINFPKADFRFLVRVALNVARAVGKVHQTGCVIGDFNHSGVLVSQDATVALIDADSFQFSRNGHSYQCLVGVPDFTPPELQGTNLGNVVRTRAHDHFGLAVAIFHLLAMGRHPYAGRFAGGDLTLGEAIAQNRFAFSTARKAETRTTPPPGSVGLGDFPPSIANAFEAAFGSDPAARPDAAQWVSLLKELETSLSRCSAVKTHYYPSAAGKCVWCRLASQSGVDMFPDLIGVAPPTPDGTPFDLEKIWAQVRAIKLPLPEELLPQWPEETGDGTPEVRQALRARFNRRALGGAALVGAIIGFVAATAFLIAWVALAIFGFVKLLSDKTNAQPFRKAYEDANLRLRKTKLEFLKRIGYPELQALREELERSVAEYRSLDKELSQQLAHLKSTREGRQRAAFLDRFLIRRAKIPGIGPAKTTTLASFGIETANDIVAHAILAIPGFGDAMTAKLLAWRKGHEAKFRYNPAPDASDVQAENALRVAHAKKRADLQSKIRSGAAGFQAGVQRLSSRAQGPDQPLIDALNARAIADRDLQILGIPVPPVLPLTIPNSSNLAQAPNSSTGLASNSPQTVTARSSGAPSCPHCSAPMQWRTARRGVRSGRGFWGCSRYPRCTGTRN
jgi:DNA-binding helix-hairpin-helix protein with protein kinase domain